MKKVTAVGLDLAKLSFRVHGVDEDHRPVIRKALRRSQVLEFFAKLPACLVGMEACSGSRDWARKLRALGHDVRLIAPQYVKPYVKTNKTDAAAHKNARTMWALLAHADRYDPMHRAPVAA
jgi:transposase